MLTQWKRVFPQLWQTCVLSTIFSGIKCRCWLLKDVSKRKKRAGKTVRNAFERKEKLWDLDTMQLLELWVLFDGPNLNFYNTCYSHVYVGKLAQHLPLCCSCRKLNIASVFLPASMRIMPRRLYVTLLFLLFLFLCTPLDILLLFRNLQKAMPKSCNFKI